MRARAQSASDKLASIPAPDRANGEAHVFGNFFLFFFLFGKIVSIIRIINGSLFFLFFFLFCKVSEWNRFYEILENN